MQPSVVNAQKEALLPVVRQRQSLADALARYLTQLSLLAPTYLHRSPRMFATRCRAG